MLRKHWTIQGENYCVLCDTNSLETRGHLFFDCPFAKQCWTYVGIQWPSHMDLLRDISWQKSNFTGPCFTEILACVTWNIWKARNDKKFQLTDPTFGGWKVKFLSDISIHQHRLKKADGHRLLSWTRCLATSVEFWAPLCIISSPSNPLNCIIVLRWCLVSIYKINRRGLPYGNGVQKWCLLSNKRVFESSFLLIQLCCHCWECPLVKVWSLGLVSKHWNTVYS